MEDNLVKRKMLADLDLEICNISNSLMFLNETLNSDFEDYILKKSSLFENKNLGKHCQELITSLTVSDQSSNNQTQKYVCTLNNELKTLCEKLEATVESHSFAQKMIQLDETLHKAVEQSEVDSCKAAEHLVQAKKILDESSKCGRALDFYKNKTAEYYKLFAEMSLKSLEKWDELVNFKSADLDNKMKSISLSISTSSQVLMSVYQTLELLNAPYKETFCKNILKEMIDAVIFHNCKLSITNNKHSTLMIEYSLKSMKMDFVEVVNGLVKIFEFINNTLDLRFDSSNGFISSIGSLTGELFLQQFISEHLFNKIPLKRIHLDEYKQALQDSKKLLDVLLEKGFICDSNPLLKEYLCEAGTVFENKVGSRFKNISLSLMKQDLHDVITIDGVSLDHPMPELHLTTYTCDDSEKDYWNSFFSLFNNDYRRRSFLTCQVSKSINDLIILIQDCLGEANQTNSNLTITLHNTAHEIVYEYIKSPEIHRKLLDIIPQQSALVFTNTLYLLTKLVHFDKEYKTDNLFYELIGQLQNMAFRELNKQVRIQEDIILSSLQKSGLSNLSELEVFPKIAEKAIRQCLRQVVLLQTVWATVLPQDVYCIVIGRLISKILREIINYILEASDIREEIANNLVELIALITDRAPQVFPESREVHRYVKNWLKLREVSLVLAGSLADISERWAGGSGPLAHELEASQVRSLIVALFQSSEIRQRTLSLIK